MNIYPQEYISFIQKFQLYTALSQVYSTMVYPTFSQQLGRSAFNEEKDLNTDKLISSPLLKETFPAYSFFTQDDLKKAAEYILSQNINKDHLRLQRKGDTLIYPVSDDDLAMMHDIHKVFYLKKNHLYAHIGNSSKITYNALNQPIFQYDDSWYYINNQPVPFIPASSDLNKDIIGYAHANVNNAEAYLLFSKKSYEAIPSIIGYIEIHDDSAVLAKGITALTSNDTITLLYESFQLDGSYSGLSPLFKPVSFDNTTVSAHALPKDTLGSLVIQDFYHTSYFSTFLSSSLTDSQ